MTLNIHSCLALFQAVVSHFFIGSMWLAPSCCLNFLSCRLKPSKSIKKQTSQSVKLIVIIATLYCLWCASQIYWVNPRRAAVGEEADLGVLVFLAIYFFLPHTFCIMSMNPKDHFDMEQLPIWQHYHYDIWEHHTSAWGTMTCEWFPCPLDLASHDSLSNRLEVVIDYFLFLQVYTSVKGLNPGSKPSW